MDELIAAIEQLGSRIEALVPMFDLETRETRVQALEKMMEAPEFWTDGENARTVSSEHALLKKEIASFENMRESVEIVLAMAREGDSETQKEYQALEKEFNALEVGILLKGEYDSRNAIVSIHAGAGGTDAMDWAGMLTRMYARFFEKQGWKASVVHETRGEEAGVKSITMIVQGSRAYGYLRSEHGVHRLVRISPFDAEGMRHTSFALVEVMPELETIEDIAIDPKDLRIDTFLSSGKGGQNVQKNETAVRLTHVPTGIAVACQSERSQLQNKAVAMKLLTAKLMQIKFNERKEQAASIRGEYQEAAWGNQIRSYVLHPYHQVKDHRTGFEVTDPEAVLDGELMSFIESYLRMIV